MAEIVPQNETTDPSTEIAVGEQEVVNESGVPNRGQGLEIATDNGSSNMDGGSQAAKEEGTGENSGFGLRKLFRQADENKWTMDQELANHFTSHTRIHVPDADMKLNLEDIPPPANIDTVLRLDNTFKSLLRKEPKGPSTIDMDGDWETVQQKVLDVMGPLGVAWSQCALYKKGDLEEVDVYELANTLELSVLSRAQVMQKISWYRRIHCLSTLGPVKNARETLREEKVQEIFEKDTSTNLFPKEFDEHLKTMQGTRQNVSKHFKPEEKKKKKETTTTAPRSKDRRFVSRPFPASPSKRGGGYNDGRGHDNSNSSFSNKNPFSNRRFEGKQKGQGKHARNPFIGQHAFTSGLASIPQIRPSKSERLLPCEGSYNATGRKNSQILGQLEVDNQRPENPEHSERLGNSIIGYPTPKQDSSGCQNEHPGGRGDGQGDRKHAVQGSHQGGHPQGGSIPEQCLRNPKRGGTVPTHYQSQETKRVCSLPPLQNGGLERCETSLKARGLDVQNRLERCILLSSPGDSVTKICPIQLERETVRVSLSSIRSGSRTQDFHETHESSNSHLKEAGSSTGNIPRRHSDYGLESGGSDQSKGYNNVSFLSSGSDNQYGEVSLAPMPGARVLGSGGKQLNHGFLPIGGKETKIDFSVSSFFHPSL